MSDACAPGLARTPPPSASPYTRSHSTPTPPLPPPPTDPAGNTLSGRAMRTAEITTCLWFDTEGEEAAEFYCSVFPNSRSSTSARYGEAGPAAGGHGDDRRVRARRPAVRRAQRRPASSRSPRRSRSRSTAPTRTRSTTTGTTLPRAARRARAAGSRTASGCPGRSSAAAGRAARRPGPGPGAARDGGDADDEEDRHRRDPRPRLTRADRPRRTAPRSGSAPERRGDHLAGLVLHLREVVGALEATRRRSCRRPRCRTAARRTRRSRWSP